MPAFTEIPAEIVDHIVDGLHDDPLALRTCAIACKTMLPRARFHLYKTVCLDMSNYRRFYEIASGNPELAGLVRVLKIWQTRRPRCTVWQQRRIFDNTHWFSDVLLSLTQKFVNVKKLELEDVTINETLLKQFNGDFPALQELRLSGCIYEPAQSLCALYLAFPRLQKLKVGSMFENDREVIPLNLSRVVPSPDSPQLTTLCLKSGFHGLYGRWNLIDWIIDKGLYKNLQRVEISDVMDVEVSYVQRLIDAAGPSLQRLYLGITPYLREQKNNDKPVLDLSNCTRLVLLGITGLKLRGLIEEEVYGENVNPAGPNAQAPLTPRTKWLAPVLSTVSSPSLATIHFVLRAYGECEPEHHIALWEPVAGVLAGRNFRGLQRIAMEMLMGDPYASVHTAVPHVKMCMEEALGEKVELLFKCHRNLS
ncbi:hypothetical protein K474DRAFT_1422280 [Panus rudis PR-1116 ss-1]|nr:hypothetical protein K474DRAFT_1422280 [Panus rudis PR-1116 ss-1]